jgi:hypothetical protein
MLVSIQERVHTLREEIAKLMRANDFFKDHTDTGTSPGCERREQRLRDIQRELIAMVEQKKP